MPNPPPGGPTDRPHAPPRRTVLADCALILVRTQGPVNLGQVARLCGNLGITDLRLVAPECEVNTPDARKFSTHSREQLLNAPVFADLKSATADCGLVVGTSGDFRSGELGRGLLPQEVPQLLAQRPSRRWALVFGNEADGLDADELRACQAWIHLETFGINTSFNLAMAVGICSYVIATAGDPPPTDQPPAADRAHVEALGAYWLRTLERFEYFRRAQRDRFEPLFEKFLGRLHLSEHDVQVLRGMLAQFHWYTFKDRGVEPPADAGPAEPRP